MIDTMAKTWLSERRHGVDRPFERSGLARPSYLILIATMLASVAIVPAMAIARTASGVARPIGSAKAGLATLTVVKRELAYDGMHFGAYGQYEKLDAVATGYADPKNLRNAFVKFLDKAPRNAAGLVKYKIELSILRPVDPGKASGKIFYEMVNRGRNRSYAVINRGSDTSPGNAFLMKQGYAIVSAAWQPDAYAPNATYKATFPIATDNGKPITARIMEILVPDTPRTAEPGKVTDTGFQVPLTYPRADPDSGKGPVSITVRELYDDPRRPYPSAAVHFLDGPSVQIDTAAAKQMGMDAGAIYELVYTAKDPYPGGLGFVATRDLASFMRNAMVDRAGNENPLRPGRMPIRAIVGWGNSQGGRALRDMLYTTGNADLAGRKVFDGVIAAVAGSRKTDHTELFARSSVWIRQHDERDYPGAVFPFSYASSYDPLTGRTDGILASCTKAGTCPKLFHEDSDLETWNGRISLVSGDATGKPLSMPANVRLYMMSGGSHAPGDGVSEPLAMCKAGSNPIDFSPVYRGLIAAMFNWILDAKAPPPSLYPNVTDGTLIDLAEFGRRYPRIPGQPFNLRHTTGTLYDFSVSPPRHVGEYPLMVPDIDRLGNPLGGVMNADVVAPLGTYSGRNYRVAGHAEDDLCPGTGGFVPLAATRAQRMAQSDPRPSLEELYPGGDTDFAAKRRAAVDALIKDGYVLSDERNSYATKVPFPSSQ